MKSVNSAHKLNKIAVDIPLMLMIQFCKNYGVVLNCCVHRRVDLLVVIP